MNRCIRSALSFCIVLVNFCGNCGTPRKKTENKNDSAETIPVEMPLDLINNSPEAKATLFSIRNGIQFGMSIDQVKQLEKLTPIASNTSGAKFGPGEIAGIQNSTVDYHFTDGKLHAVYMRLRENVTQINVGTDYKAVNTVLTRKYGPPLGFTNDNTHELLGWALKQVFEFKVLAKITHSAFDYKYDEWVIDSIEGPIKIDHFYYWTKGASCIIQIDR